MQCVSYLFRLLGGGSDQQDGMLLSRETWGGPNRCASNFSDAMQCTVVEVPQGPKQVCLKHQRAATHWTEVGTFSAVKSMQSNAALFLTLRAVFLVSNVQCSWCALHFWALHTVQYSTVQQRDDYANALGALSLVTCEIGHSVCSFLWCAAPVFQINQMENSFFCIGCIFNCTSSS